MEGLAVEWWMWFLFGILLLLAEFVTPGAFYQFFFGVGALVVGVIGMVGLRLPLAVDLVIFLVVSVGTLVVLRRPLLEKLGSTTSSKVDRLEGETALAMDKIAVDGFGKAELRGTVWNARNVGWTVIAKAERCRVMSTEGVTLCVSGLGRPEAEVGE